MPSLAEGSHGKLSSSNHAPKIFRPCGVNGNASDLMLGEQDFGQSEPLGGWDEELVDDQVLIVDDWSARSPSTQDQITTKRRTYGDRPSSLDKNLSGRPAEAKSVN